MRFWIIISVLAMAVGCISADDPQQLLTSAAGTNTLGTSNQLGTEASTQQRLDALRSLLKLQKARFDVNLLSNVMTNTTSIDHDYIAVTQFTSNTTTFLATPNGKPDVKMPEGDYWRMELLTFERSGRLISRQPYQQQVNHAEK
jgi:hypothetical protein